MNLFTVSKIPVYCEGITHRIERRKSGDTKVVDLTLKIAPFTAQLATALNQDEYGFVKRTLFKMASGDPVVDLRAVEFLPPGDRQRLTCFAAPDTDAASICLDQVRITKIRARSSKDAQGWTLYIGVSFGPLDKNELEYVNRFYTSQAFITWEEAEPSLEFTDDEATDDEPPVGLAPGRPAPMFDDDGTELPSPMQCLPHEKYGHVWSENTPGATCQCGAKIYGEVDKPKRKKKKVDHDAERVAQKADGVSRANGKDQHGDAA